MLSIKKLLAHILSLGVKKTITLTRVNNSYVDSTSFNRLNAYSYSGIGILRFNLQLTASLPSNTTWVQIGTMSPAPKQDVVATIPSQSNNSTILLQITSAGIINILNSSGIATGTSFFRAMIPFDIGNQLYL